jgi:TonB family protein
VARQVSLANDAVKRGWATRVAWSTVLSTAVHAAAFGAFAYWAVPVTDVERTFEETPLTITSLGDVGGGSAGRPAAVAPREVPAAPGVPTGEVEDTAGPALETSSPNLTALWERIAGGGAVAPTVVAPEPTPDRPTEPGLDTGTRDALELLGTRGSTADLVPELDHLMLERLSVLRPELALTDPSFGVLVRNPLEIDAFMRRTYDTGELVPGEQGVVSVALWIDERGSVRWAEIDQSSGRPAMDEVALELFREVALFRPAREDGVPVSRSAIFYIRFPWVSGSAPFVPRRP